MDRRTILAMPALAMTNALVSGAAKAQTPPGDPEFVLLWPGTPPGGDHVKLTPQPSELMAPDGFQIRLIAGIQTPGFFVYRPARPNGLGLLIIPGGGYSREAENRGARDMADYFTGLGITCFVLRYRLPGEGWDRRETVPLQDAQRAMRLIKSGNYNVDPAKLAVIGFSAGGHLSAVAGHAPCPAGLHRDQRGRRAERQAPARREYVSGHHHGRRRASAARTTCCWARRPCPRRSPPGRWNAMSMLIPHRPSFAWPPTMRWCRRCPTASLSSSSCAKPKSPRSCMSLRAGGHAFGLNERGWPDMFMAWAAPHGFKA